MDVWKQYIVYYLLNLERIATITNWVRKDWSETNTSIYKIISHVEIFHKRKSEHKFAWGSSRIRVLWLVKTDVTEVEITLVLVLKTKSVAIKFNVSLTHRIEF